MLRLMRRRVAAVTVGLLCTAGALWPDSLSSGLNRAISEALNRTSHSGGPRDRALQALGILAQGGFETQMVEAVKISTESIANGPSPYAVVSVRDPKSRDWVRVDPTRNEFSWPWTESDKTFYGNYWIAYRGPLSGDPASAPNFYRDTLDAIPKSVLNEMLFRFRFTVESPEIGPDGKYRNPNVERFLRDNGKILEAHGIHPILEVPVGIWDNGENADERFVYWPGSAWFCIVGRQAPMDLALVTQIEDRLSEARQKGQPPLGPPPPPKKWPWIVFAGLCAGVIAVLIWQRQRFAGRETAVAYWACQILGWGIFPAWAAAVTTMSTVEKAISLVFFVSGILLTHLLRRVLRRRGWLNLSAGRLFARLATAVALLAAVHQGLQVLCGWALGTNYTYNMANSGWILSIFLMSAWAALYVLITGPRRQREVQVRLQLSLREAELRALEAQINPHFLFNSLNSIRALVTENPAKAQDMLTRLANILRYSLQRDVEHTVPLASEVEVVNDYLAIESARFEDRLRVQMTIDPDAGQVQVPPMLLQSLVENALKHGIAPLTEGGDLTIRARLVGDQMLLEVENPGEIAEPAPEGTQLGISNIRERLRILYSGRAKFELKNRGGRVAATALIPRTV
jgi:two-component system, LytTR family, sensor kinase